MVEINFVDNCIFKGTVFHKRFLPFKHQFKYKANFFWFDINKLNSGILFKHNKFSLFSFFDEDHGAIDRNKKQSLFKHYLNFLKNFKIFNVKTIKILCLPRILSYQFNPISVFVCFDYSKKPVALILQVSNTFGERHAYLFKVNKNSYLAKKQFHVSPFFKTKGEYEILFKISKKFVKLSVSYKNGKKKLFYADFSGNFLSMKNHNLIKLFLFHFFQNFKVTLGIHYEALKLWIKGAIYYKKPNKPKNFITKIN